MDGRDGLAAVALDPRHSVVVEACAGSGKTWLLTARIVRLLLAGCAPGEILAITFTRKAAREIEQRLAEWLHLLAVGGEETVRAFLQERGVTAAELDGAVARARGLYERVLAAQPPLTVSTFHGWFMRLVQGAPLASDLAGFVLHEAGGALREEVWQLFAADCGRRGDAAAASLLWLLGEIGLEATRALMFALAERRAEWHAHLAGSGVDEALRDLRRYLGVGEVPAADVLLGDELFLRKLREYAALLRRSELEGDQSCAAALERVLGRTDGEDRFARLAAALLTQEGMPRQRRSAKRDQERFGAAAARFAELHAWLGGRVAETLAACREEQVYALNRHVFLAGAAWLEALETYKRERRLMDFTDLEWHVWRMLADEDQAAFLQARLDARYRHILLDEFQDTNPLQWRILLAWLAAYERDDRERPRVFLVGDPKQSIYRFRRAEARVFAAAAAFLQQTHGARLLTQEVTRRNAPPLVAVINRLFEGLPDFPHFRRHRSLDGQLPGRVELLPLCGRQQSSPPSPQWRDPLRTPRAVPEAERCEEAALLARRLGEIVGRWQVIDKRDGTPRPARYGDVMVLTRRRGVLPEFERALRLAGIPYISVGRGGLLGTLEAADLTALLRSLVTPADDLALAHALRTPLLGADDEDLLLLAARTEADWWSRLAAAAADGSATPVLARAATLLERWRELAMRLPVHDLLDRVYHEGELMARYRAAVPAALWPAVAANLEAYIALALRLDAGRYPSLPRFLDELARLGEAGVEEAPDEGMIAAQEAEDRVRLLTIHAAKGLEAPIVWLIDAHNTHTPPPAWSLLVDWPPQAERPAHFSVLGRKAQCGARRAALIEAEAACARREELNLLYVAMTRARQYFFASGSAGTGSGSRPSDWERIAAALAGLGSHDGIYGDPPVPASPPPAPSPPQGEAPPTDIPAIGRRRPGASAAMAYGSGLHLALDWLSAGGDADRPPPGIDSADWPALRQAAQVILQAPRLREFFDPACYLRARNEVEFALPDGSLGRIDRLVERRDGFWVLDYKSGRAPAEAEASQRAQLEKYRAALAALHPGRPVRCALVFGDGTLVEV